MFQTEREKRDRYSAIHEWRYAHPIIVLIDKQKQLRVPCPFFPPTVLADQENYQPGTRNGPEAPCRSLTNELPDNKGKGGGVNEAEKLWSGPSWKASWLSMGDLLARIIVLLIRKWRLWKRSGRTDYELPSKTKVAESEREKNTLGLDGTPSLHFLFSFCIIDMCVEYVKR